MKFSGRFIATCAAACCRMLVGALVATAVSGAALSAESWPTSAGIPEVKFVESLPSYQPEQKVSGTINLWGHGSFSHDFMGNLVKRWMREFSRDHPDVKLEYNMFGTASAIGALSVGAGNVALLGEEISPLAEREFKRARGYAPTEIEIATGSLDTNYFDYAHMIFVNQANPIRQLGLAQLDSIFGYDHKRGGKNIRTWGELGLTGEWANKPIHPHAFRIEEDFGFFFRGAVLEGSHRWNPDTKEYVHIKKPDGTNHEHAEQIIDAVAKDPYAIGISSVRFIKPSVKMLPIAKREGGPYYEATNANLISQNYPLARIIPVYIDRAPGQPADALVREFLRYVLSREGQTALIEETGYLPLGPNVIRAQLEKLK